MFDLILRVYVIREAEIEKQRGTETERERERQREKEREGTRRRGGLTKGSPWLQELNILH